MKRIVRVLVAVAVMTAMMVSSAFAAGTTIDVTADKATAVKGDKIVATVSINGNTGFKAYGMQLDYDKAALELVSIEKGALSADGLFSKNTDADNAKVGTATFAGSEAVTTDGVLFTATFEVLAEAGDEDANLAIGVNVDKIGMSNSDQMTVSTSAATVKVPAKQAESEEPSDDPVVPEEPTVDPTEPVVEEEPAPEKSADTDDNFNIALFGALALAAVAAGGCTVFARRRG